MSASCETQKPLWFQLGGGKREGRLGSKQRLPAGLVWIGTGSVSSRDSRAAAKCAYHPRGLSGKGKVPADRDNGKRGLSLSVGKQEEDMGSSFRVYASCDMIFTILARWKGSYC